MLLQTAAPLQTDLAKIITAVAGLGTAAFGVVDAGKALFGINHIGFSGIRAAMIPLLPTGATPGTNGLTQEKALATLNANWINGTDLAAQKAIAKSLVKLNLHPQNAAALAAATGVNSAMLQIVAQSIADGTPLTPAQSDVYARFDLIVTALLDEAYQRADQVYRNWTRTLAMLVAVILAIIGGIIIDGKDAWFRSNRAIGASLLVGLLATPLAPIAKDLSSAIAAAVNAAQSVKKS